MSYPRFSDDPCDGYHPGEEQPAMHNDEPQKIPASLQFRKKPVVIEAYCYDQKRENCRPDWFQDRVTSNEIVTYEDHANIHTLEGVMRAELGDWIIKGIKGEVYPCKPDIFEATYEPASRTAADGAVEPVAWQRRYWVLYTSAVNWTWGPWYPMTEAEFNATEPKPGKVETRALVPAAALTALQQRAETLERERDRLEISRSAWEDSARVNRVRADEAEANLESEARIREMEDVLKEARNLVGTVVGENRPAREWAIQVRDRIEAALADQPAREQT